jgi:DedD protein
MASSGKRGGGDRVLESRHLVGLFLGVVLLCGVFFTLGYVMGRTQYGGSVHAETLTHHPASKSVAPESSPDTGVPSAGSSSVPPEWDFYKKSGAQNDSTPAPPKKTIADESPSAAADSPDADSSAPPTNEVAPPAAKSHQSPGPTPAPKSMKSGIVLQVAALRHESDALAMAGLLQQKRFPAFVSAPVGGDNLYHVQVGPYPDEHAADAAKATLDHDGFKAIVKH